MILPDSAPWQPLSCDAVATLLGDADLPWWIAGGRAIDLFLGRESRRHADIDVGLLRRDQRVLFAALAGWEIHAAHGGRLRELDVAERAHDVAPELHGFWCRRDAASAWAFELLLEEGEGDIWHFRRDTRVRRPLVDCVLRSPEGIPYLTPEVQLLFKAKAPRPVDELDFAAAVPLMSVEQRTWLRRALAQTRPAHAWIREL